MNDQLPSEGLRERKKRQMRQLISDTATRMFMERGFDEVTVAEVAEEVGISEKTIYNYFTTKESLLLDREDDMTRRMRSALGPDATEAPVDAVLHEIEENVKEISAYWVEQDNPEQAVFFLRRMRELVDSTPSLRSASREMMDRISRAAAEAMAERAGLSPDDPEPFVAAQALTALWLVYFDSLSRHMSNDNDRETATNNALNDVRRAARMLDAGLWSFGVMMQGNNREQMAAASAAAQKAGKQVFTALRQAHTAWRELQKEDNEDWRGAMRDQSRAMQDARKAQSAAMREQATAMREIQKAQSKALREQANGMREGEPKRRRRG